MKFTLVREDYRSDGIFSALLDEDGFKIASCLEHAYPRDDGTYTPKVAAGTYTCIRHAPNRLPYETFMLENVPPFQNTPVDGILMHVGNFMEDSIGCILVGDKKLLPFAVKRAMVTDSRHSFEMFMKKLVGEKSFELEVRDK